jgi:hypothetical protein
MEIRIHTQSGSIETFVQDDPAQMARLLEALQPARVFAADIITIAGDYSLTTFVTSRVTRVDLLSKSVTPWKNSPDVLDVVELSEDEFRERSHLNDPVRLEPRLNGRPAGEAALVFVDVEMTGGNRVFLAAKIIVPLLAERLHRMHLLFSSAALHFRLGQGGVALLNLKNLIRYTINPGPDRTPRDAWPAHHFSGRRAPAQLAEYEGGSLR